MENNLNNQSGNKAAKYDKRQKATIFVTVITAFITTFTGSALNLSIPAMGAEFHVSAGFIGWLVTGYMLTVAALSVPFGRVSDMTSRKRVLVIGIGIFATSALAAVFSWSIWMVLALRVIQGIGAAMVFSTNTAILISAFPGSERGRVLGYSIASTYIGLSAGPVLGGFLNHYAGWRSIFLLIAAISFAVLYIAAKMMPKQEGEVKGGKPDILGNILYVGMILLIMYGLSAFATVPLAIYMIPAGVVLAVLFVCHEMKTESPVVEVRMFYKNGAYTLSNLAALLNYGATFATSYLLSIYLQVILGYSSQMAGLVLIVSPGIMAILSPLAGRLSDRISPFKMASLGMGLCSLGLIFFIFIQITTPIWMIIAALAVSGTGFALFSSPNTNAVMACVEKEDYGVASSILATMRSLGHTSSMVVVTIIVSTYMGELALADAQPELIIRTMHTGFIIFTVACVVGIFISLKRKQEVHHEKKS